MIEPDTFLTALYVMADDFCKTFEPEKKPGPAARLSRSEILSLALLGQFTRFQSEHDFWDYADQKLRGFFPGLSERSRFNRQLRRCHHVIIAFALHLSRELIPAVHCLYEVIDTTAVPVRNVKRRGRGHLAGQAAVGYSARLGWYDGFHLMLACTRKGVITGFAFASGGVNERPMAEAFFALRAQPQPQLPSVGRAVGDYYVADKGFEGAKRHDDWQRLYDTRVISAPRCTARGARPEALRRWISSIREIVETVVYHIEHWYRLEKERPHTLEGFWSRLSAKVALHNFVIWINRYLGQPDLTVAGLLRW